MSSKLQCHEITIEDPAILEPIEFQLEKRSTEDGAGAEPPVGAEFEFRFYEDELVSSADELEGKTPDRTWKLTTYLDDGVCVANFNDPAHVSGSEFYLDANGNPALPVGTIEVVETKAAEGYNNDPNFGDGASVYIANVRKEDDGSLGTYPVVGGTEVNNSRIVVYDTPDIPDNPEIGTTAKVTATGVQLAKAGGEVTIEDTVTYEKLQAGKTYTLNGRLMYKDGSPVNDAGGNAVTATKTFTPSSESGQEVMTFTFNADEDFEGKTTVVFETLSLDGKQVASHEVLSDKAQAVYFPSMGTTLVNKATSGKVVTEGEDVELEDTITYENLLPNTSYTVSGVLMDKATEEELLVGNNKVTSSATFRTGANETSGTVKVTFSFNTAGLGGKSLVAYEEIAVNGSVVAEHKDINDSNQTVDVTSLEPYISTVAKDAATGVQLSLAGGRVTIEDTVSYWNLTAGKEYTLNGVLMDKATGSAVKDAAGKEVTATKTFTPDARDGKVSCLRLSSWTAKTLFPMRILTTKRRLSIFPRWEQPLRMTQPERRSSMSERMPS